MKVMLVIKRIATFYSDDGYVDDVQAVVVRDPSVSLNDQFVAWLKKHKEEASECAGHITRYADECPLEEM